MSEFFRRGVRILLLAALLAGTAGGAPVVPGAEAQDPRALVEKALAAYREKDYPAFRENLEIAVRLRPGHPGYWYFLAMARALTGAGEPALAALERVAAMGLAFPAEEEPAFDSLRGTDRFRALLARFEANNLPVHHSDVAFTVPEKRFIAEGLAWDAARDRFLVGSVRRRKIVSVGRDGSVRDFTGGGDGLWGAFGMRADSGRGVLWVASAAVPEMEGYRPEDEGKAGIFLYDLETGKLLRKFFPPGDGKKHLFGDLALSGRGDVYVTDSSTPALYRIRRRSRALEPVIDPGPFVSLQGIAVARDGKALFVSDYSRGIFRVDLKDPRPALLEGPEEASLLGIDGLYLHGRDLIGVQNGTRPKRVIRLVLEGSGRRVERLEVLESNSPGLEEPTLGEVVGDRFFYVANSEWEAFDAAGAVREDLLREPAVWKLSLGGR